MLLALIPRVLAALAFRPALLTADSFLYMQGAVNGPLGVIRPSGYSFLLFFFKHLPHPLLLVTTLQHLMGIAIAVIVYALLRYWGLPGWGASLAAAAHPVRRARDRAGVLHPARHRVLPGRPGHGRAAADPAHAAACGSAPRPAC